MSRPLVLVAAVARNGGIGVANRLPWRLKSDMVRFRALTMGHPVVMGRRTFESIGRPLPGRHLVVVSRDPAFGPPGVALARSPDAALSVAETIANREGAAEIVLAGGAMLYAELIGRAARLEITDVDLSAEADAFFPPIDPGLWRETSREPQHRGPADEAAFSFVTYERY